MKFDIQTLKALAKSLEENDYVKYNDFFAKIYSL